MEKKLKRINKMKISKLVTLLLLVITSVSIAQTVTIPADNSSSSNGTNSLKRKPLGSYYGYERSAFIYSRYELGITGASSISSIAFYCDSTNNFIAANTPVKVYVRAIEDSVFISPTTLTNEMANATLVYSGTLASSSFTENNWTTLTFNNNFNLNDSSNLELIIETNAGGTGNEGLLSKGFRYKTAGQKRFQYWQQDNTAPTGTGALDTLRPNITINYTAVNTCSLTPNAGVIISSDTAVCTNNTIDFYLQGSTNANELSYLWQTSTDNINWTSVTGNNLPNYTKSIDTLYYLRTVVSCVLNSDTTPVISVNTLLPIYCYCNSSLGGNCSGYSIDSLTIETTTFNPTISGCENNAAPHYSSYPASGANTATLSVAQTYSITIRQTGNNVTSLWIDEDHDGNFEQNEWIALTTSSVTNGLQTKTFSIPASAYNGLTGMRVRSRANGFANDSTKACTTFTSGETEDFLITIAGGETIGLEQLKNNFSNAIIYPNPSNGTFHFQSYDLSGEVEFTMFDVLGKIVFTTTKQHYNLSELNSNVVSGTYFLIAKDKAGKMLTKKLIVE